MAHEACRWILDVDQQILGNVDGPPPQFNKERRPGHHEERTEKELFELERDAYAHLVHYGACEARIVPRCLGWIELSPTHIYDALKMIRRTRETGSFERGEEPAWVSPIFEDGSCACALLVEYIPNGTPISQENLTMERMDRVLRTISRLHGAYVGHGDLHTWSNVLLVREGAEEQQQQQQQPESERERVVLIDFDWSATPQSKVPVKPSHLLRELSTVWTKFYTAVVSTKFTLTRSLILDGSDLTSTAYLRCLTVAAEPTSALCRAEASPCCPR